MTSYDALQSETQVFHLLPGGPPWGLLYRALPFKSWLPQQPTNLQCLFLLLFAF